MKKKILFFISAVVLTAVLLGSMEGCTFKESSVRLINVSYDPTRELYSDYNAYFTKKWKAETGQKVAVVQSHGGSGSQARSVIEGLPASVATLALGYDITKIEEAGLLDKGWQEEYKNDSAPYTSTIVFLVRKGNPKNIRDWDDVAGKGIEVITPNPKSSGGACWNFLAAWSYAIKQGDSENEAKDFLRKIYHNVTVLDSGARGSAQTFIENGQGDVLLSWENEAYLAIQEYPGEYEIISPSISIKAEPSVALVDDNLRNESAKRAADAYIRSLYDKEAQRICAENFYRPSDESVLSEYKNQFDLGIEMTSIADFGGWKEAYAKFFRDGAVFDQITSG